MWRRQELIVAEKATTTELESVKAESIAPFSCKRCDFYTIWENALKIHVVRKHEQINGDVKYWKSGKMTSVYQTYLDVCEDITCSDLPESEQDLEQEKALEARKVAIGDGFKRYPPWNQK